MDRPRPIEVAFPLKQASLDLVHAKNVRHGQISTLRIWPAPRPLAAYRSSALPRPRGTGPFPGRGHTTRGPVVSSID